MRVKRFAKLRNIVIILGLLGVLLLSACGDKNADKSESTNSETKEEISEEEYIIGLSEDTVLAIASEYGDITKDMFTSHDWDGYTNYRTKETWDNYDVFNCSYDLTSGGHIKAAVFQSGKITESDVESGKHAKFLKAVADGITDPEKTTKINEYVNGYINDDSLWKGGYNPVQINELSIGISAHKDDADEHSYHFDVIMEYTKSQVNDNNSQDSPTNETAESDLPDGQYYLNDSNLIYKVGENIPTGVYHIENYSNDFKCIVSDKNSEVLEGNILEGYSKRKIDNKLDGYCANSADANSSLYNNTLYEAAEKAAKSGKDIDYNDLIISGTISQVTPSVLTDSSIVILTKADSYVLCAGGEAILVLDEEYDQQKAISEAKLPDFGTWNGNDYTNEGLGINLHVPSDKKMGWRPSGDTRIRNLYVTGYNDTIEDMPPHVDVIDEVTTLLIDIGSYTNSSLSVMTYDTSIPVGEMVGSSFYNATPDSYMQRIVDDNNNKAKTDPEHYTEVKEIKDDTVFGMDAKWVNFVTKDDQPFGWETDADYNTTYTSVWVSKKDNYLIVTRLKFTFAQMNPSKPDAEQYNKEKYDECMDVVSDILGEL